MSARVSGVTLAEFLMLALRGFLDVRGIFSHPARVFGLASGCAIALVLAACANTGVATVKGGTPVHGGTASYALGEGDEFS